MTIEFHQPPVAVHQWVIDDIRNRLVQMHNRYKEISRVEVHFREEPLPFNWDYVCEIDMTIYGSSFLIYRNGESYLQAVRKAMSAVTQQVDELVQTQNDLPEVMTSTVEI